MNRCFTPLLMLASPVERRQSLIRVVLVGAAQVALANSSPAKAPLHLRFDTARVCAEPSQAQS